MKKVSFSIMLVLVSFLFSACAPEVVQYCCKCCENGNTCVCEVDNEESLSSKVFSPTSEYVRAIGRTQEVDNTLWLVNSGTGLEFELVGTSASITVKADSTYEYPTNYTRIAIYVDDKLVIDDLVNEKEKKYNVFESETPQKSIIRVVKLSEALVSTVGISEIEVMCSEDIKPTEEKDKLIEFIGDSLTSGYGLDDPNAEHTFSSATENVTKTYAYKTAEMLEADYSIISASGFGVLSGKSEDGTKNEIEALPRYYTCLGTNFATYLEDNIALETAWDFAKRQPDVIVINLGSNDYDYTQSDESKNEEFAQMYLLFLKHIREKNPNATILCTLGMKAEDLFPCIEYAVWWYTMENGDTNVYTMRFDTHSPSDGYAADWHPSEKTHDKAAEKLTAKIKEIMGW